MYYNQFTSLQIFARIVRQFVIVSPRCYATKRSGPKLNTDSIKEPRDDIKAPVELGASFFAKNIGSAYKKWQPLLKKYPELKTLKAKDVLHTMEVLKKYNFTIQDVLAKPMILYNNGLTLENRYRVLKESGFATISLSLLSKYVTVVNRSAETLKAYGYIPYDLNVVENLRKSFTDIDVELKSQYPCNEQISLRLLRQNITNYYLHQRIDMTDNELDRLWKTYQRIRHKSFDSLQQMIEVLLVDLQFPKERIRKNKFVLHGDPDNVRRIIKEIPTIDGHDIREILHKCPKILMSSCDGLHSTLQHIKNFGISENPVYRCLEVLTLGPDTVHSRLKDLNQIEEFQVLITNPRVLRLIHYQNKARLRLDYLNQLRYRCASLHILCCASETFAKFARDGSDRTKGCDIIVYLSIAMNKCDREIRTLLSRHTHWCHIPALHIKKCYEYLKTANFTDDEIFNNIHLLLYPMARIEEKLEFIKSPTFFKEMYLTQRKEKLDGYEQLNLALYLIESEFHFTGDGIWTEQQAPHVENFNNLLPDFPESLNKIYKYGSRVIAPRTSPAETVEKQKATYVTN